MSSSQHPLWAEVQARLAQVPLIQHCRLTAADAMYSLADKDGATILTLAMGFPYQGIEADLNTRISAALTGVVDSAHLQLGWAAAGPSPSNASELVSGVKHIVAVSSGKGGVGKSTTTANVGLALASLGARVGILDADIYGPSQAQMLGVADQRPQMAGADRIAPIEGVGGVSMVSMGNLVDDKTPMVWRGPMVSGALQQLLRQTAWQEIDYLLIDMPPGTGDIQLTLSQTIPVSGSIIVTTPQDIALLDAKKGIEMFRKVNIPVLGVVENMSTHVCSQCGHEEAIFGEKGGDRLAEEYQVSVLGRLPLTMAIREKTDAGQPNAFSDPESNVSQSYRDIARLMCAKLWQLSFDAAPAPEIKMVDD